MSAGINDLQSNNVKSSSSILEQLEELINELIKN